MKLFPCSLMELLQLYIQWCTSQIVMNSFSLYNSGLFIYTWSICKEHCAWRVSLRQNRCFVWRSLLLQWLVLSCSATVIPVKVSVEFLPVAAEVAEPQIALRGFCATICLGISLLWSISDWIFSYTISVFRTMIIS